MIMSDTSSPRRRSTRSETERAGYITMEDENLPHSGVRGGRSCCLCLTVFTLFLLAVINALVTAGLLYFLSITHEGMASLEILPETGQLRILSDIEITSLQLDELVGKSGTDLHISGKEVAVGILDGSQIKLEGNKTYITSEDLELTTVEGKPLFSTSVPLNLEMYHVTNLHASAIDVGSVRSQSMFPDLLIESFSDVDVYGMEGVEVQTDGTVQIVSAHQNINIQSIHGSLNFHQEEGIVLTSDLPMDGKHPNENSKNQYKMCVCGSNGRVFIVQDIGTDSGCHSASETVNPCL